ncbi:MAG: ATPase domain-containing protein [Halobacteriaceae archaeon]
MTAEDAAHRCDFCRLKIADDPVTMTHDGVEYSFCCTACRDAMQRSDRVYTQYHDFKRVHPGLAAFDVALPQGLSRNSFVLLTAQAGTRQREIQTELVWRTLQRGEPAVIVSFTEPPISIIGDFLSLDWNVFPALERGDLHIIDCFTYRLEDRERFEERLSGWNRHVLRVANDATIPIEDPTDLAHVLSSIDSCLEACDMVETGIVVLDSLTELGTLVQTVRAYDFVKDLRAEVGKGRFVPVFAGATRTGEETFPHDLDYVADGVIDLQLADDLVEDTLIRRARIRKMSDVLVISEWTAYEYTSGEGMVAFDPLEEIEKAEAARDAQNGDEG